ncbi:DUF4268 domain-containing protein [Gaoshiqia sediminis]|uniref:DUF4268 domain-containing protein n=1 Tax=Gaoshiqia sediminis TaxID=2986998 RepID=A0AA41Y6C7_9BACT|nr:DUF4268 domain-containing protein [Gaoshiqia sediminis]MCW0482754.1 DUF4268 domain-containing protein [Gaoshiqia sediminis]
MYTREEAKQLRKKFWTLFGQRCEIVPELAGRKKKWVLYDTKISGLDLKFDIDRNEAMVMIEINHRDEDRRLAMFELLEKYKPLLEDGFDEGLHWELCYTRDSGEQVCRIFTTQQGLDIHRQNQWPDIYNFFIEKMLILERNFMDIRDVIQEELRD